MKTLQEKKIIKVNEQDAGIRIDKYLSLQLPERTRSGIVHLIEGGDVLVCGKSAAKNYKLRLDDEIEVIIAAPVPLQSKPEDIPLDILYEDDDLLVVNKPKGMVVHPAAGNREGTLVNALLAHCGSSLSGINGILRPGIVHRIDKDTSGLLLVAKNDFAHNKLAEQIKSHTASRTYEAVVCGNVKLDSGTVEAPIGRHPKERKKMAVTAKNSKVAVTHYEVICRYKGYTHVRLQLETGRTHQIRVHMAYIGHPVAGDTVYGVKKGLSKLGGQCLHARTLRFTHPRSGKLMEIESPLPDYFVNFLKTLEEL